MQAAQEKPEPDRSNMVSISRLIELVSPYLGESELVDIQNAFLFAHQAHSEQFRATGEPYITHPIAVAENCAKWRLDAKAIQAALLHDTLEDCGVTKKELIEQFDEQVADLVDGLSKLDKIEFSSQEEAQAENFRKMLLAMARDLRVILIKLADRLHNMRTLGIMSPQKKRRIARETLEIFAPIAHRLGLNEVFRELQDLSFQHSNPYRYEVLRKAVDAARGNRREVVGKILQSVQNCLSKAKISCDVQGTEKPLYGIYRKMSETKRSFSEVLDIYCFQVIVDDTPACYSALGALHQLFKPIPGKFKDYIAIPKMNNYQSLHTMLIGPYGTPVEFQIRTKRMHRMAEQGVIAHWCHQENSPGFNQIQLHTHHLLQSLLDIQSQTGDAQEFLEHIKVDLFPDAIYVFTPNGKIMSLNRGATIVDFAYAVHTDVGNQCVAGRVNHIIQPLRTELKSGDVVEIITAAHSRPNPVWLSFVRSGKARSEIRHYLKSMNLEETIRLGFRLLNQTLESEEIDLEKLPEAAWNKLLKDCQVNTKEELLSDIGAGRRLASVVARRVLIAISGLSNIQAQLDDHQNKLPILIHGDEGMSIQLATCCMPIAGDGIIGYLRKGAGLIVHINDCELARKQIQKDPQRWINVKWDLDIARSFEANVDLVTLNEKGALASITAIIAETGCNIANLSMSHEHHNRKTLHFKLQIRNKEHLEKILIELQRLEYVEKATRVKTRPVPQQDVTL